jgi:hypothetical protein
MGILDQVIEKKDIKIYIDTRCAHLRNQLLIVLGSLPAKNRNAIRERFAGRIKELELLGSIIDQGKLKKVDKTYWNELHANETGDTDELIRMLVNTKCGGDKDE